MRLPEKTRQEIERRGGEVVEDEDVDRARARVEREHRKRGIPSPFEEAADRAAREGETDCESPADADGETAPDPGSA